MRVLRIADVTDNRSGGMSRTMYATGDELVRLGHEVEYWFENRLSTGVRPTMRRFIVPWRIVRQVRAALKTSTPPDVVEIHEPLAGAYAWCRSSLPPLVVFSYGLEQRSHRLSLAYRQQKHLPISLKNRFSPLTVVWQAVYASRHAAHVICSNSEDVAHLRQAGVPAERLTLHHSGVEPEFLEAGGKLDPQRPRQGLLFLGSWLNRKGILELVPAASNLLRKYPTLTLTVAGCGAAPETVQSAFEPSVRGRILVRPSISGNAALIDLYQQHSIFVLPSFFEGQPLVMIEAAALGLAIVTTAVCGMRDFITDGENGFLVPVGDPAALEASLDRLVRDPELGRRLGQAAYRRAQGQTWRSAAEKIARAYQQALQTRAH